MRALVDADEAYPAPLKRASGYPAATPFRVRRVIVYSGATSITVAIFRAVITSTPLRLIPEPGPKPPRSETHSAGDQARAADNSDKYFVQPDRSKYQ
jgi:hypothetical protein